MLIPQIIRLQAYDLDRIQQSEDQKTLHFEGDFRPEKPEPEFRKFRFRKTRGENELANFKNLFVNHQRMSRTCSQIRSEFQEFVRKSGANFKNLFANQGRISRKCSQIRGEFQELVRNSGADSKNLFANQERISRTCSQISSEFQDGS